MMKNNSNYYTQQAFHIVKQYPDLDFKEFKKLIRRKAGTGLTCDFEKLYQEYKEYRNGL